MSEWGSYGVYAVFALGAAAIYFLLPRSGASRSMSAAGWVALGLAGLTAMVVSQRLGSQGNHLLTLGFSAMALLAGLRVITHPKPVYSAVYLVGVVLAVAGVLVLQEAEFLAIALIIIYAGAILVTYLFVIMLAQQPGSPAYDRRAREPFLAVAAGLILTGAVAGQALPAPSSRPPGQMTATSSPATSSVGNTTAVGVALFTKYVVVAELSAVLLLISMVGAVALSRKRVASESELDRCVVLGEVGKGVAPF
jgi:NADH-quinone oxidoreductase subunit J